jgi:hypothetical protein
MPEVKTSIAISVAGGPRLAVNHVETVEAYDVIEVTIPPQTVDRDVQIQPAIAAGVSLLLIQSSRYGPEITYRAVEGATASDPVELLGPQLFGRGVLSLFGNEVLTLRFSNANPAPAAGAPPLSAQIQILVGRDATP